MARTSLNPAIRWISGRIDQFVYRHQPDGSMTVAKMPLPDPNRKLSAAQVEQVQRFRLATAHCWRLLDDPDTRAAYQRLSLAHSPLLRLHSLVISDIMKPPVIRLLDLSNYHGNGRDTIRVVAEDNVAVARLSLIIRDHATGRAVETFEKRLPIEQLVATFEWRITVTTPAPVACALEVCVTAFDLAGNKHEAVQAL